MDNKIVLMVLFTIILGMLVANMFKEVCGCKNLIEGQCGADEDCEWNPGANGFDAFGNSSVCPVISAQWPSNYLNTLCVGNKNRQIQSRDPGDFNATNWKDTVCCGPPGTTDEAPGGSPVIISDDGCITGGGGAITEQAAERVPMINNPTRSGRAVSGNHTCDDLESQDYGSYSCDEYYTCVGEVNESRLYCNNCCTQGG